jgi:hypothetical protein
MTPAEVARRAALADGTTAPLVAGVLGVGEQSTVVGDTLETALRIKARAREPRLTCYRVARACPVDPGLTYQCRTCAAPVAGAIDDVEATLEVLLLAVGDVFGLGVAT